MPHRAVEVDRAAGVEHQRRVEFRVQFQATLEHVAELLALVLQEAIGLGERTRADDTGHGRHLFAGEFGAQIGVALQAHGYRPSGLGKRERAPGRRTRCLLRRLIGEQLRNVDLQAAAQLQQLRIGERELAVFDPRQRGFGDAGEGADFRDREAALKAQPAQARPEIGQGLAILSTRRGCGRHATWTGSHQLTLAALSAFGNAFPG